MMSGNRIIRNSVANVVHLREYVDGAGAIDPGDLGWEVDAIDEQYVWA
jgi:hypothetical protein